MSNPPRISYFLAYVTPAVGMVGGVGTAVVGAARGYAFGLICGTIIVIGVASAWTATHVICENLRRSE